MAGNPLGNLLGGAEGAAIDAAVLAKYATIAAIAGPEVVQSIVQSIKDGRPELEPIPEWLAGAIADVLGPAEQGLGQPLFELLIRAPTGAELQGTGSAQEATAVQMVQRMLGFAFLLPWGTAQLAQALEAAMGQNAPKAVLEAIKKLPEDLGINWALGTTMANIMDTATGTPIREAISRQQRPFRLEWPQLRALFKTHQLTQAELHERLIDAGVRDVDLPLIESLGQQLLSVGDLQTLFEYDELDEAGFLAYADQLGFSAEDATRLRDLYLRRAETAGGDQLRGVAQRGFLEGHFDVGVYRQLLAEANVPPKSIELEVQAAQYVKAWGRTLLSASELKRMHDEGIVNDDAAIMKLLADGYAEEDAHALVSDWKLQRAAKHPGLNEARILSYLAAGVISGPVALDKLIALGINSDDARFLVEHPTATRAHAAHGLTPGTVIGAMKDGVITQDEALQQLLDAGESPAAATERVQVALAQMNRGPKPRQQAKQLSEGQVIELLHLGIVESTWAARELVTLGYSDGDAQLLVLGEMVKQGAAVPDGYPLS